MLRVPPALNLPNLILILHILLLRQPSLLIKLSLKPLEPILQRIDLILQFFNRRNMQLHSLPQFDDLVLFFLQGFDHGFHLFIFVLGF